MRRGLERSLDEWCGVAGGEQELRLSWDAGARWIPAGSHGGPGQQEATTLTEAAGAGELQRV